MSIVGIIECKDGVIGFSDSNYQRLKGENDQMKKVFSNNKTIICSYGKDKIENETMEEFMQHFLQDKDGLQFSNDFVGYMKENSRKNEYDFVIYDKLTDWIILFEKGKVDLKLNVKETGYYLFGNEMYIAWLQQILKDVPTKKGIIQLPMVEIENIISNRLTKAIEHLDLLGEEYYNPAGLPLFFIKKKYSDFLI